MKTGMIVLRGGPMDGWVVRHDAPVLRPGWKPLPPRRSLVARLLRRPVRRWSGRYVVAGQTAVWVSDAGGTVGPDQPMILGENGPEFISPIRMLVVLILTGLALHEALTAGYLIALNIGQVFLELLADGGRFRQSVEEEARRAGDAGAKTLGDRLTAGLRKAGKSLQSVGMTLTKNVTLPIVAAGAAIFSVGKNFDTTLRQIVALTDTTADEIGGVRDAVLSLAGEVGKAPQELAEGFYFLASAGFETAEALEVLKSTAKASAVGLGTTADISKVVGAAINAYGKENLTAADAVDILLRAVKNGTAEAPDFAAALGNVIGTAAVMGATFSDVTAAVAALTIAGVGTDEAVTSLNQVLVSLLKPTNQAEEALDGMGLSSEGLRKQLKEKGLLSLLQTLEERFAGNDTAAAEVFGNVRALRGVLQLLGLDSEELTRIFEDTASGAQDLAGAFEDTEGPGRAADRAFARIQTSLILLSDDVLPIVADLLERVSGAVAAVADWFSKLPKEVRGGVVQFLALAAAAGPVLWIVGKLTSGLGLLYGAFRTVNGVAIWAGQAIGTQLASGLSGASTKVAAAINGLAKSSAVQGALSKVGSFMGSTLGKFVGIGVAGFLLLEVVNEYNRQKSGFRGQLNQIGADLASQIAEGSRAELERSRDALQTAIHDLEVAKISPFGGISGLLSQESIDDLKRKLAIVEMNLAAMPADAAGAINSSGGAVGAAAATIGDKIEKGFKSGSDGTGGADGAVVSVKDAIGNILGLLRSGRSDIQTAASDAADAIFGPQIAQANLAATEREIGEERQTVASKTATREQKEDAQARLNELNRTRIEQLAILAGYGDDASRETILAWARATVASKTASVEQIAAARHVIDTFGDWRDAAERLRFKLAQIVGLSRAQIIQNFSKSPSAGAGDIETTASGSRYAEGGYPPVGQASLVGEKGPELFVPKVPGLVLPSALTQALLGGSSGDVYNIGVNLPTTARPDPFETARELRRMSEMGVLAPKKKGSS